MKAWQHDVLLLFEIAERKSERIIVKVLMNEEVLGGLKFFEENWLHRGWIRTHDRKHGKNHGKKYGKPNGGGYENVRDKTARNK